MNHLWRSLVLVLGLSLVGPTAVAEPTVTPNAAAELAWALGQLNPVAQAADPAVECAACIGDCTRRYGRACHLLCRPYSLCGALCGDRQRECNNDCNTQLSCRRRIRSCSLTDVP